MGAQKKGNKKRQIMPHMKKKEINNHTSIHIYLVRPPKKVIGHKSYNAVTLARTLTLDDVGITLYYYIVNSRLSVIQIFFFNA